MTTNELIVTPQTRVRPPIFWLALAVIVFGFLYLVRSILLPFGVAMAVAYFFDPLVRRLQRAGLPRWSSALLVLVVFLIVIVGGLFIAVPVLEKQVVEFAKDVPGWIDQGKTTLLPRLDGYLTRFGVMDQGTLSEQASGYATTALSKIGVVLAGVLTGGLALLDLLSLLLVTPVAAFYLLRDWDAVEDDFDRWLPRAHADTLRTLFHEIDRTLSGFIRGQALVCLIQAIYYAVALSIAGLEFGALVGIATGILTFIPYLGAVIGLATGIGIALAQWGDTTHVLIILGVFAVGQIMEANLITPKLVGDRIGLHPVWVIFAVLAGGALFGFPGILLGVPVAAVVGVLMRFGVRLYTGSRFYRGTDAIESAPDAAILP